METKDESPVSPLPTNVNKVGSGTIRARRLFLTYAKCPLGGASIVDILKEKIAFTKWVYGNELHQDGTPHTHVLIHLAKKPRIEDMAFFDIVGENDENYHPNIKVGSAKDWKPWWNDKVDYCMKDGDFDMSIEYRALGSKNYRGRKADMEAWFNDCKARAKRSPFPFTIGDITIAEPLPKKCNFFIIGKPDQGKTTWINGLFGKRNVYFVPPGQHKWDGYVAQRVVVFNDLEMGNMKELVYYLGENVDFDRWLPARYNNKILPKGRIVSIILCNVLPDWVNAPGVQERFHFVEM